MTSWRWMRRPSPWRHAVGRRRTVNETARPSRHGTAAIGCRYPAICSTTSSGARVERHGDMRIRHTNGAAAAQALGQQEPGACLLQARQPAGPRPQQRARDLVERRGHARRPELRAGWCVRGRFAGARRFDPGQPLVAQPCAQRLGECSQSRRCFVEHRRHGGLAGGGAGPVVRRAVERPLEPQPRHGQAGEHGAERHAVRGGQPRQAAVEHGAAEQVEAGPGGRLTLLAHRRGPLDERADQRLGGVRPGGTALPRRPLPVAARGRRRIRCLAP